MYFFHVSEYNDKATFFKYLAAHSRNKSKWFAYCMLGAIIISGETKQYKW